MLATFTAAHPLIFMVLILMVWFVAVIALDWMMHAAHALMTSGWRGVGEFLRGPK